MKKILVKILRNILRKIDKNNIVHSEKVNKQLEELKEISLSTETANTGYKDKYELLEEVMMDIKQKNFSSTKAELLAKIWFNVDMSNSYYQLRYGDNSILFFSIRNVNLVTNDSSGKIELTDMIITLFDESLNSSLMLTVSIKDFKELFQVKTYRYNPAKAS